ncbi:MAG: amidohydrolase [Armatimonadetes bacterium]|nr:amidohydrolase [Armatimonadota bacterium]
MSSTLRKRIVADLGQITEIRHDIHRHPELLFKEERTSNVVQRELKEAGIEFKAGLAQGTGVLGFLPATTKPETAKTVALRADMDALPILEETGLPYASENEGVMHACGHDGHTSILIGASRALVKEQERRNNILLMFQPAEEGGAGGKFMCQDGVLDGSIFPAKADVAYGLHGWPTGKEGVFGVKDGAMLAATDQFRVVLKSPGGHAAAPHHTSDTIVAASQIITALQTVASRNIIATQGYILTVTFLNAGNAYNVIPASVNFGGTMRTLTPETQERGKQRFNEIVEGVGKALGVDVEIEWMEGYPVTFNDPWATDRYRRIAASVVGQDRMQEQSAPWMAGEDFSFYGEHVPACFFFVGLCPDGQEKYPPVHTPLFNFNDAVIPDAIETMCRLALEPVE